MMAASRCWVCSKVQESTRSRSTAHTRYDAAIEVDDDGAVSATPRQTGSSITGHQLGVTSIFVSVHTVGWFDLVEGRWRSSGSGSAARDLLSGADLLSGKRRAVCFTNFFML